MTATVFRVRGRELPKPWAERAGLDLDEDVQITIEPLSDLENETLEAHLEEGMEQVKHGNTHGPFDKAEGLFQFLDGKNET